VNNIKYTLKSLASREWLVASRKSHLPLATSHLPVTIFCLLLFLASTALALPLGDPRTPGDENSSKDIPVDQGVHEVSIHAFMGASKIDYPDMGWTSFSPGFGAAITYSYFFHPRWAILFGGGLQLFNNRETRVNGYFSSDEDGPLDTDDFADYGNDKVLLYYNVSGYTEKQWSLMFTIPVMFQYLSNESRNKAFYYALGAKIGIPFAGSYEGSSQETRICGYYPYYDGSYFQAPANFAACNERAFGDGFEDMGFGNYGRASSQSRLKLSTAFFAAAEAGVKWRLYNKFSVYTGFWMDWALNDVAIRTVSGPFTWKPNQGHPPSDVKTPWSDINFGSRTYGSAIPVSMGFTFRVSLGGGMLNPEPDSVKWLKRIYIKDSLLQICQEENKRLRADSVRAADSILFVNVKTDALLDSLIKCKGEAQSKEELRRLADSLARAHIAEQERLRIAALEKARNDSLERAAKLEAERASRLMDFRKKLSVIANGLDNYSVTQTTPSKQAREKLDVAAELMRDYPDLRLRIIGHTCDMGTNEANVRFGTQRAESARNYMVNQKGLSASRFEVKSRAELEPIVPNINEASRRKNRRIQLEIIEGADEVRTQMEAK